MIKAIIPACGFGTRMNMTLNRSKELLLDENEKPLIEWHLNQCWYEGIEPLVLVRKEKQDLIDYLIKKNVEYLIMEPGKEWAETVYNSKDHWAEKNILLLPDTRYEPLNALKQVKESLLFGNEVIFAVHKIDDPQNWGCIDKLTYEEKSDLNYNYAWGIIGFTKESGKILFKNMQHKSLIYLHEKHTNFIFLDSFKDLTRTNNMSKIQLEDE